MQDGDQGALGTHQRATDVEVVLGEQRVQVVARHASRDVREPGPQIREIFVTERVQPLVDLAAAPTGVDESRVLLLVGWTHPHPQPVVRQHLEPGDIVGSLAVGLGRRAAGVVPDHSADGARAVGRGAGPEHQPGRGQFGVQVVQRDARLDHTGPCVRVQRHQPTTVSRPVDDHCSIGRLTREAGAATARQHRDVEAPTHPHRRHGVVDSQRCDHPERGLPIVRGVLGVRRASLGAERHLARHNPPQPPLQSGRGHCGPFASRWLHSSSSAWVKA